MHPSASSSPRASSKPPRPRSRASPSPTSSSATRTDPDFGRLAAAYERLRPADANWREVFEAVLAEGELVGRTVVDVGCGTGRFARLAAERGAFVAGVDPSPEMLAEAARRCGGSVALRRGAAEALPYPDGSFERAVLFLAVHLLDRPRAFAELRRVLAPGGGLVIATFLPEHFRRIWMARYFPSLGQIDRARFPPPPLLRAELRAAGFRGGRVRELGQRGRVEREAALERLRSRSISTLSLLSEAELRAGIARAERELEPVTAYRLEWAIVTAER